jgi:hypothetical protein
MMVSGKHRPHRIIKLNRSRAAERHGRINIKPTNHAAELNEMLIIQGTRLSVP